MMREGEEEKRDKRGSLVSSGGAILAINPLLRRAKSLFGFV
jgi:hypothetical protein